MRESKLYTTKEKILRDMSAYYHSEDKAKQWYDKPHKYFTGDWGVILSPKDMVELNRGNEVLQWIKLCIS